MRVDGDIGLNLSIHEVGARLASVQTTGVGACARHTDERASVYEAERAYGQDSQQCHYGCKYKLNMLDVMHPILLLVNFDLN
jgi:hypothetical protein